MITSDDYKRFCKEYVFDKLRDISFGDAFCKRFGIQDIVLSLPLSEARHRQHVHDAGYV